MLLSKIIPIIAALGVLRLKGTASNGGCCDCAQQVDACSCTNSNCSLQCQFKSSTADLCGYAEFANPSTPPKYYRQMNFGGNTHGDVWTSNSDCLVSLNASFDIGWAGSNVVDPDTCHETVGGVATTTQVSGGSSSTTTGPLSVPVITGSDCSTTETVDKTSYRREGNPDCCPTDSSHSQTHSGARTADLADEDTPDDAIARAEADAPDWAGCDCSSCSAWRTDPSAGGTTFGFKRVQVRIPTGGLPMGASYTAVIGLARRILGTGGPYISFGTIEIGFTVDGTGATDWQEIPQESGWETIATTCNATAE